MEPLDAIAQTLESMSADVKAVRTDLHNFMYGPPDHPEHGAYVRLDRLEQAECRRSWATRTLVGAWLVAMAGTIYTWFRTGGPPT